MGNCKCLRASSGFRCWASWFSRPCLAVPSLYAAIGRLGAAQASLLGTLEPLFTVLLAFVVLHEPLRPSVLVGGSLILGGAVLSQWRFRGG